MHLTADTCWEMNRDDSEQFLHIQHKLAVWYYAGVGVDGEDGKEEQEMRGVHELAKYLRCLVKQATKHRQQCFQVNKDEFASKLSKSASAESCATSARTIKLWTTQSTSTFAVLSRAGQGHPSMRPPPQMQRVPCCGTKCRRTCRTWPRKLSISCMLSQCSPPPSPPPHLSSN